MDLMLEKYLELRNRLANEEGQTMAEYGLLLALIAVVVIGIVTTLGGQIRAAFTSISAGLTAT